MANVKTTMTDIRVIIRECPCYCAARLQTHWHIRNEMLGFWGRMNTKLWMWLSEKEEKTKDVLTTNYIAEIYKQDIAIKRLSEELEN